MAGVTELGLLDPQETLGQPSILFRDSRRPIELRLRKRRRHSVFHVDGFDQVSRMAILAGDAEQFVLRPVKERLVVARDVAVHASPGVFVRLSTETEDQVFCRCELLIVSTCILDCRDVRLAGTVTTFATAPVCHTAGWRLRVRGFQKLIRMHRMASDAGVDTRIIRRLSLRRPFPDNRGW